MLFINNNTDVDYFNYSLETKVEFYFNTFFDPFKNCKDSIIKYENEIKQLIFNELDAFELNGMLYQTKKNKHSFGVKNMHSELGHLTSNWSIDWAWIIHHITLDYVNIGKALYMMDNYHKDKILVYKYLPDNYYDFAQRLYLEDLTTKQPRVFDLKNILQNGHGLKSGIKRFVPLVGVTLWNGFDNNYWDLTELRGCPEHFQGMIWNKDKKDFDWPEKYIRTIERKSKIIIMVGDKRYEV